jgi:hypothetical protein
MVLAVAGEREGEKGKGSQENAWPRSPAEIIAPTVPFLIRLGLRTSELAATAALFCY